MYRLPASIRDSAIRLLPRISYPFGEIRGNNLFDSHIRHPGTVRGDSYYQRIGFEQVLLVDEKTYEQSCWWRQKTRSLVNRGIQRRTGSVQVLVSFSLIRYFVCSVHDFPSGAITSFIGTGLQKKQGRDESLFLNRLFESSHEYVNVMNIYYYRSNRLKILSHIPFSSFPFISNYLF